MCACELGQVAGVIDDASFGSFVNLIKESQ